MRTSYYLALYKRLEAKNLEYSGKYTGLNLYTLKKLYLNITYMYNLPKKTEDKRLLMKITTYIASE